MSRDGCLAIASKLSVTTHISALIFNYLHVAFALHYGKRQAFSTGRIVISERGPMVGLMHFVLDAASVVALLMVRPGRAHRQALRKLAEFADSPSVHAHSRR
jgi:hypothetical protein